jgi:hypothetical protein
MGDGILDGYPIIQDQTSPNLAHIPTTNEITYSEDFSGYSKTNYAILENQIDSPFGTLNAAKIIPNSASGVNKFVLQSVAGLSNGVAYSLSIFAKAGEFDKFRIEQGDNSRGAWFDLTNGTILSDNADLNSNITFVSDGWYRCEVTSNTVSTSIAFVIAASDTTNFQSGDSIKGVYVIGSQVEEQSQATAYIKSDGIAAVRKSSTTNLITYSEDFSSYDQIQNITLIPNATTSPIGTNNATKVLSTANNSKVRDNISVVNGTTYTFSIYCKNIDATMIKLLAFDGVTEYQSALTSQVSTTQWTRISITFTSGNTGSGQIQFARDMPNGESAFFWGAQFEEQTQAETYAKTTGLPVTIDLFTENNYGTMTNMSASDIVEDTPNN